jgi:HTH DNA binding domain
MASDLTGGEESWLRPVWEDADAADLAPTASRPPPMPPRRAWLAPDDILALLPALCAAQDALARLDARAAAAPESIQEGLVARIASLEAAGWLAHHGAWIHPRDLALRALGLTAGFASPAGAARELPNTHAAGAHPWPRGGVDALLADAAAPTALALARLLRRLPRGPDPFADAERGAATVAALGAGSLDPARFATWRAATRAGQGDWPPLLAAALLARRWMEAGIVDRPNPAQALFVAAAQLARGVARAVPAPLWAAYPAIGRGDRDDLPGARDASCWPEAFLRLLAEAARASARELDRLLAAADKGARLAAGGDRRSRLPDAIDAALREPVLTPKALAHELRVAPQTATALLRALAVAGVVREVTGRRSFRAFAI